MAEIEALIFDVDGTLAETEELHRRAFNRAFARAGLDVVWDRLSYARLLAVTGGKRRLVHFFTSQGRIQDAAIAGRLHAEKNRLYAEELTLGIQPRPGVTDTIERAKAAGLKVAIATTTGRGNLDALLAAMPLPRFDVVVTAEDVTSLKPHPEVYRVALTRLGISANAALAFEDSMNGLAASTRAGIQTIVTPSLYTESQEFAGAVEIRSNLVGFDWTRRAYRSVASEHSDMSTSPTGIL